MDPYLMLIIGIVGGAIIAYILLRKNKGNDKEIDALSSRLDNLNNSVNEALRDTMKMVSTELKDSRQSTERATLNVHKQVEGFTSGVTKLAESVKGVHDSVKDVSSFQEMFRSPKLRGIWGEQSLEASLEQFFTKHDLLSV